ncbi:hypothetical protein CASFOL_017578 [Castilleja foliolosa]|uniref:Uncharacterized protein n=1 Tax=Castilleja foliolosa TaxID=1961234 RepID=A0ABD3DBQ5_9LAMI
MGTRRPLILQMVHDSTALEPRCRFQRAYTSVEKPKQRDDSKFENWSELGSKND